MERIVFVTRALGIGGTEKHLVDLIERLDPSRFEVVVLVKGLDPYSARLGRGRGPHVRIAQGPANDRFAASWRVFRSLGPDVVVFVNGDLGLFHWQMYLAARFSGARRVVEIEHLIARPPADTRLKIALRGEGGKWRGLASWLTGPLRRAVTTRMPGLVCHATICVSDAVRDRLVRDYGYPAGRTVTRHNGVEVRYFARDAEPWGVPQILAGRPKGPVAVCVSLLVPRKRVDLVVRAMKEVVQRYPSSCCVIVGSGMVEGKLRSLVEELGMEEGVLFAGHADDVRPYLAAADIFVFPSEREGLPLALLEATAFGLPCVATEAGGKDVIEENVNGLIVPPGSAAALADAIQRLFGDREERVRMGKNARRIAEEKFDLGKSMARVTSVILGAE